MSKKSFFIVISAVFMFLGCGGNDGFTAVNVGECLHEEPAFSFKDRIYTGNDSYPCKEYVEVTEKKDHTISFNWFGAFHCDDWEYGYEIEGIEENVLKVSIKERDLSDLATDCDNCCRLMPIEYTASTAEEIESLKGIEINYEGKNHKAYFKIK
ncbi:hypothetical protein IJG44_07325 [bacterium]|nr:hypothetical protein [bacterium]